MELLERRKRAKYVVINNHHAKCRMTDHNCPERKRDFHQADGRADRDPGHDTGQCQRQDEHEGNRLFAEEVKAVDSRGSQSSQDERHHCRKRSNFKGQKKRCLHLRILRGRRGIHLSVKPGGERYTPIHPL